MNQCMRLLDALVSISKIRPIIEVKMATIGILTILGNVRSVR